MLRSKATSFGSKCYLHTIRSSYSGKHHHIIPGIQNVHSHARSSVGTPVSLRTINNSINTIIDTQQQNGLFLYLPTLPAVGYTSQSSFSTSTTISPLRKPQVQNIEKLFQSSQKLLQNHDKMNSTQKTKEISRLITEWNKIWPRQAQTHVLSTSSINDDTNNNDTKFQKLITEGVDKADKLAHVLLDIIQEAITQNKILDSDYQEQLVMVLTGWSKVAPSPYNGRRAQQLVDKMDEIYMETKQRKLPVVVQPNTICYGMVLTAYSLSIDRKGYNNAVEGGKLLKKMEERYISGENPLASPNLQLYNSCLHGYAKRGMVAETEALIEKLESFCDTSDDNDPNNNLCPDVYSYSICINAYEKCKGRVDGKPVEKRAEDVLNRMMKRYEATGNRRFMPNQFTFGTVIALLASNASRNGASDADRILHWMIGLHEKESHMTDNMNDKSSSRNKHGGETYPISLQPTTDHYVSVLFGYCKNARMRGSTKRMHELLVDMENRSLAGNDAAKPNYQCFVIYLDALIKSGNVDAEKEIQAALARMEDMYLNSKDSSFLMNNYGYNLLIDSISKSNKRGRVARAEAVLSRMNELYAKTGNASLLPDKVSYTSLIKAITMDRGPNFTEECKSILTRMEDESRDGNLRIKPDLFMYNVLINSLCIGGKPEECEELLDQLEEKAAGGESKIYPNIRCYNIVMNAYCKGKRNDSWTQTERIFRKIEKARAAGNSHLKLSNVPYGIMIDALARSNAVDKVQRAESWFNQLIEQYESTKDESMALSTHVCNALILVYINSNIPNKAEKAFDVIKLMKDTGLKPDIVSYNSVLTACWRTSDFEEEYRKQALDISTQILGEMKGRNDLKPDTFTYKSLVKVSGKMIQDLSEKKETIKALFKHCCDDGEVTPMFLGSVKSASPPDFFRELLGKDGNQNNYVDIKDLPPAWTRNFRPSQRFKR